MTNTDTPRHPIRVVAQRTGLTTATIRAWERRYEAVQPTRSEGGQRLYSDRDVKRLKTLSELTSAGRPISMVAALSDEAASDLLLEDRAAVSPAPSPSLAGAQPAGWVDEAYTQIRALDAEGLERTLWHAVMNLGARGFLDEVVSVLLDRVGAGWVAGEVTPGQEHLGSEVLDRVLERLVDRSRPSSGPAIVVATLPGERHGLGARLVSVAAVLEGWNVTYLGTDLPVVDIASTAEVLGAGTVAISVVGRNEPERTAGSLVALREVMNPSVDILVGGRGSRLIEVEGLPDGITVLDGLDGLGERLRSVGSSVVGVPS